MQRLTRTFFQASCLIACFPAHAEEIDEILVTAVRRAVAEDQLSISLDTVGRDEVAGNVLLTDALRDAPGVFLHPVTAPILIVVGVSMDLMSQIQRGIDFSGRGYQLAKAKKLKIYTGTEHPHEAQEPKPFPTK